MQKETITITKRSGDRVAFDIEKLKHSLERSGAGEEEIQNVITEVQQKLFDGISTRKVYQLAYAILRKTSHHVAGKYRLKKAMFELGPTGYPFERFVGELLKFQGFKVEVGKIVQGHCVTHEVDVVAEKDDQKFMIECKFHSDARKKSDVKVSLYIHSRFLDVEKQWNKEKAESQRFHQGWIVTNTRFTEDATNYGKCVGLHLISWDYPAKGSLRERIDKSGFHPLTALNSLNKKEKQALLDKNIVLCQSITSEHLTEIGLMGNRIQKVLKEAKELSKL